MFLASITSPAQHVAYTIFPFKHANCCVLKEIYDQSTVFSDNHSEFSDIFDEKHFKRILQADVRVVSSLPSTHLMSRQSTETKIPHDVSPLWIRSRFFNQVRILC